MPAAKKSVKKSTKKSSGSKSKAVSSEVKALRQLVKALTGQGAAAARPRANGYSAPYSMYGAPGPANGNESLEYVNLEGNQMARINCGPGKFPDYESGECKPAIMWNTPCYKGQVTDPVSGECKNISDVRSHPGIRWENGRAINVGIPMNRSAWGAMDYLPVTYRRGTTFTGFKPSPPNYKTIGISGTPVTTSATPAVVALSG